MKKIIIILICLLFVNPVLANKCDPKTQITADRQIYSIKRRALSEQLEVTRAEYSNLLLNNTNNNIDSQKITELENRILEINKQKAQLKETYEKNKKQIKKSCK